MAASDNNPQTDPARPGVRCMPAAALSERVDEEIARADRHGTALSCLLVVIENLDQLAREHGGELREQTLAYIAGALPRELRRFDRIGKPSDRELMIVLPGADGPRGEIVARRVLDRVRTIKVEIDGARQPLRVSVGLAVWREQGDAGELLGRLRTAATRSGSSEDAAAAADEPRAPTPEALDYLASTPPPPRRPTPRPDAPS